MATVAVRIVSFTDLVGLTTSSPDAGVDLDVVDRALTALVDVGVGRPSPKLSTRAPQDAASILEGRLEAVINSPMPGNEWLPMSQMLGEKLLATLVDVSSSSLGRYSRQTRPTPDRVAARLHVVALVVADLAGSYNDFGVRRWFERPRRALDGRKPADVLTGDWSPDDAAVIQVRDLAASLVATAAT